MTANLPNSSHPSENTLTVNITHEQLSVFQMVGFEETVAVSPTRTKETELAYDVAMDWNFAKTFIQQYKRPQENTGFIKNKKSLGKHVKFSLDSDQLSSLKDEYEPDEAFLTLPLVRDRNKMPRNVGDTLFVDVHGITGGDATLAYIPEKSEKVLSDLEPTLAQHNPDKYYHFTQKKDVISGINTLYGKLHPEVRVLVDGNIKTIQKQYVKTWPRFLNELLSCDAGILLRSQRDTYYREEREGSSSSASAVVFGGQSLPENIDW